MACAQNRKALQVPVCLLATFWGSVSQVSKSGREVIELTLHLLTFESWISSEKKKQNRKKKHYAEIVLLNCEFVFMVIMVHLWPQQSTLNFF